VLKHDEDSHIIFTIPGTNETAPGEILNIFQYWHTTPAEAEIKATYIIVNHFSQDPILDREDPYKPHPPIFGYLCAAEHMETQVIEASDVRSHFGLTPIQYNGQNIIYVLPLNRVSLAVLFWEFQYYIDSNQLAQEHIWLNTVDRDSTDKLEEEDEESDGESVDYDEELESQDSEDDLSEYDSN
jgi:hypothetical protein